MSARLAPISAAESAKRWRELATRARVEAANGAGSDRALLLHAIVRTNRCVFPLEGQGPALAADALKSIAQAYANATLPGRIYVFGRMLEAAAIGIDELLDEPALAAAAEQRRRLGEREEA